MTRKKVTLAYITNESERKASYKKRKKGLIKKVKEITVLCGVEACAIIYSPYHPEAPEVWPSPEGAQAVLARFRELSEIEKGKKMLNQDSFTRQRIRKMEEHLRRARKENKRLELEIFMFQCIAGMVGIDALNVADAADMAWVVKQMLREVAFRVQDIGKGGGEAASEVMDSGSGKVPAVSLPWNVGESPVGRGGEGLGGGGGGGGGFGWEDVMAEPPSPYLFEDHGNSSVISRAGSEFGH